MNKTLTLVFSIIGLLLSNPTRADEISTVFAQQLREERWIAYSPSSVDPRRAPQEGDLEAIRGDLAVLHRCGFTGIVTYGCTNSMREVPKLAREAGFRSVICGVWSPIDSNEIKAAVEIKDVVDAYCVGNEGILRDDYTVETISGAIQELRRRTNKAVTTSEPIHIYGEHPELLQIGDWAFPIVHPFWAGKRTADDAVAWTMEQAGKLLAGTGSRFVLLKEVGFPTAGDPTVSEETQRRYYEALAEALAAKKASFVYYEAFDQSWKTHEPTEPYWGLFRKDRSAKAAALSLCHFTTHVWFTSPLSGETVVCVRTPDGGKIAISGSSDKECDQDKKLLLFVNPQLPETSGWYLQAGSNGVHTHLTNGTWRGMVQLGNSVCPPSDKPISIAVMAFTKEMAQRIQQLKKPGDPFSDLPEQSAEWKNVAHDVKIKIQSKIP